jgi:crotonobetaine/carnitine-CoA ligase
VGPILEILAKQPPSPLEREHGPIVALAYASREIWETAARRFNLRLSGGYGSTEVGIPVSSTYAAVIRGGNPPGSCGQVGPHVEVRIMSEDGQFLPAGQTGEIVIRPRLPWTIFLEYYGMPGQTVDAFRGLWFHTGDAGYFDDLGYLFFVDRLKDAIRRKGENISSYEVEQVLLNNPAILEAAVLPAPSEAGEDEVMAVVVPKPGETATPAGILAWCRENMPGFWVPRYIRMALALPRTATGRVEKFRLREQGLTPDTWDRKKQA